MARDGSIPLVRGWLVAALWLAVLAALTAQWCFSASPLIGATYDEAFYLDSGLEAWRGWTRTDGRPRAFFHETTAIYGTMPLPVDAVTLPLYYHERQSGARLETPEEKFALLPLARAVTLGWLWLLVVSAWRLGRAASGPWAGRLAAGFIAADPNILGHASLATTDVAVSAALMAFTRAVYTGRAGHWWKRLVLPGLWFGVAALCKISALLYGGITLVVLEVCYRFASGGLSRPDGGDWKAWGVKAAGTVFRSVLNTAAILVIGLAIAVEYFGHPEPGRYPFARVAEAMPSTEPLKPGYEAWAKEYPRVPHAVCAFAFQWWFNAQARPTFLNGTFYPEGYRYYFPELLLMKVPLPIFLLMFAALARVRAAAHPLTFVALLLLTVLLKANLQIGLRLAFPAVALGYVALAVALERGYAHCAAWVGFPAVLALAGISVWVWPNGLGYLNQAHGGPGTAHWRVADSNGDWGQGVPELRAWYEANGRPPIWVWYFGVDPAVSAPPFGRFDPDRQLPEITNEVELRRAVGPHILAVGHTVVSMYPDLTPSKTMTLEYLRTRRPLARTSTFTLYDFRDEENGPPPLE
ncbi:hypothetical protein VT84_24995 [Gemmata sp. SH-PL17]|uniref:ArnT family glycosyltransferase n=1 Tax=Gemmata sp. SH-PL17 TaxID=1630693 RepID=UPI00078DB4DE|nr:hypothetical protein [Gemmata sp. SH-PL17]AMV27682.1 hypothetical protein VT84_24995 [Gemmata sp. SH-PL17]